MLCHGLEGSSSSKYIIGASSILTENNWDTAAINYRGCSGEMNKQLRMYHSGATDDLAAVLSYFEANYDEIALVGFSLGGNLVLKYCGEKSSSLMNKIRAVIGFSVPTDLQAASVNISRPSNYIYQRKFLVSLFDKLKQKHLQYPQHIDLALISKIKTVFDFDDFITGPLHGFEDAVDYYTRCSSEQFLTSITIPTLIINAKDDPFLPDECYPHELLEGNSLVRFMAPKFGGHVGFVVQGEKYYWSEKMITTFLNEQSEIK